MRPTPQKTSGKISFVSLGCPKALVDSEQILTRLRSEGYQVNAALKDADLVVINTCGFIEDAITESLDSIGEALNENGRVIVTGCLGAKGSIVRDKFPNVLAITGPHDLPGVMQAVHQALPPAHDPYLDLVPPQGIKLTPRHYAYLKISEGCNHRCSFCIIPSLRGDLVSRPIGAVIREAETLVAAGVKELLVISQDTSAYGVDVKFRPDFYNNRPLKTHITDLAKALGELGVWVRLHYVYPYPHVDALIPLMNEGLILPYLDIPFQHASPRILKLMKRPANSENVLRRISNWREACPDIRLRSTFIVGFPGETDQEFEELLEFLETAQLDRVGCFMYSEVDGAAANDLPGSVPQEIKEERLRLFMETQARISANKLDNMIDRTLTVLVDEVTDDHALARSFGEAPEVDGLIVIDNPKNVHVGEFTQVQITGNDEHDLFARLSTSPL